MKAVNWIELINTALFHHVSTPFAALAVFCVIVVAATVLLAIREIKHDIS